MYPPDHYHTMSDAQLEQYDRLTRLVDRLTHELEEANNATAAVEVRAEEERSKLLGELNRSSQTVLNLTTKLAGQQQANRRLCGEQVQIVRALRALRDLVMEGKVSNDSIEWPGEVFRALRDADEVLSLVEVPFG